MPACIRAYAMFNLPPGIDSSSYLVSLARVKFLTPKVARFGFFEANKTNLEIS